MALQSTQQTLLKIRALIEGALLREGIDLVAVELFRMGGGTTLRISIDRLGGVSLESCARTSRLISPLLDSEDLITGHYSLEVSSPGEERPLQRTQDFELFKGRRARIRVGDPDYAKGRKRFTGVLAGVEPGADPIVLLDTVEGQRRIVHSEIERAHLLPESSEAQGKGNMEQDQEQGK